MTQKARLKRELDDTRRAAVHIVLGMVDAIARTPEGRAELAQGFDAAAREADPITGRLARLVAEAIRRDMRPAGNGGAAV